MILYSNDLNLVSEKCWREGTFRTKCATYRTHLAGRLFKVLHASKNKLEPELLKLILVCFTVNWICFLPFPVCAQNISIDSNLMRAKDGELVDKTRLLAWSYAKPMIERLADLDEQQCPSSRAFLRNVAEIAKQFDEDKSPREWPEIDTDKLITSNINFWRTMLELEPGDPGFVILHISLLIAAGDIDRAHNLLHLARQFSNWPSSPTNAIATLDFITHLLNSQNGVRLKKGIALHDKKEYAEAIKVFEEALVIWPGNANATYELGNSMREVGGGNSMKKFEECRHYDPLIGYPGYQGSFDNIKGQGLTPAISASQFFKGNLRNPTLSVSDDKLIKFSSDCQLGGVIEPRLHELAIVSRQIVVGRRGYYVGEDLKFISDSLFTLCKEADTESIGILMKADIAHRPKIILTKKSSSTPATINYSLEGRELLELNGHGEYVYCLSFIEGGKKLVSTSGDRSIKIWDMEAGREILSLNGQGQIAKRFSVSPDGHRLATADITGYVRVWSLESGEEQFAIATKRGLPDKEKGLIGRGMTSVAFSDDGKTLVYAHSDGLDIYDAATGALLRSNELKGRMPTLSHDGRQIAFVGKENQIIIGSVATGKELFSMKGHVNSIYSLVFTPDNMFLATAGPLDGNIIIWDPLFGKRISSWHPKENSDWFSVRSLAFNPDASWIAGSGGKNQNVIKLWNTISGKKLLELEGGNSPIISLTVSPTGEYLACGYKDGKIQVWQISKK